MADTRGLFERLFDKSADELEKLGEGRGEKYYGNESHSSIAAKIAAAEKAGKSDIRLDNGEYMDIGQAKYDLEINIPKEPEMSEEDKAIMERIKKFRAGEDPDAVGILRDFGESDPMEAFAEDLDPAFGPLTGGEEADPLEEEQLGEVIEGASGIIFGENMDTIVRSMKSNKDFFEGAAETAFRILEKEKRELEAKGRDIEPAVFVAQEGAPTLVMDMLTKVGQKAGIPGADDPNQYAAGLINLYRKMGESILNSGDDTSIAEAERLAAEMAWAGQQGPMASEPKQKPIAAGVSNALLGGVV